MPPNVREAFIIAASTWQDSIPLASQILELHDAYRELHERMFEVMRSAPTFAPQRRCKHHRRADRPVVRHYHWLGRRVRVKSTRD